MKIEVICKNIFKNDNKERLREEFTRKWIEIINNQEKSKNCIIKES